MKIRYRTIQYVNILLAFKVQNGMRGPHVSVVILNYNGLRFLESCLKSLLSSTYRDFEIILVDNGSKDGSV